MASSRIFTKRITGTVHEFLPGSSGGNLRAALISHSLPTGTKLDYLVVIVLSSFSTEWIADHPLIGFMPHAWPMLLPSLDSDSWQEALLSPGMDKSRPTLRVNSMTSARWPLLGRARALSGVVANRMAVCFPPHCPRAPTLKSVELLCDTP